MKKTLILTLAIMALSGWLFAQERPQPRVGGTTPTIVEEELIVIDVKAFMPESGIYKAKSETFSNSGKYRFLLNDQIILENSENLLNKWLKESK